MSDSRTVPMPVFLRDDRDEMAVITSGLQDVLDKAEAFLIQEKYGLSVVFDEADITWTATDPRELYSGTGNSPAAAILVWDIARENASDGDASDEAES